VSLAPGTSVGRYRIVSMLGEGGMGIVYEADDTRLGRRVALKFLPEDLARDHAALERFRREARAASALNHPHICTIYDIVEADHSTGSGQPCPFIAMELLEGQTLRTALGSRLSTPGLSIDEQVRIALQLADALDAAHAKGILHRDLKPANVFLLDFGIAKLSGDPRYADTEAETVGAWATGAGVTLGTVGYMSPEQVRGEALDGRTDLFSLGVVLYEMATGTAPFRGATAGAVLAEVLTKTPTAPVSLNPDVPPDLERIVTKLVEKDRALRYRSASELRADLERPPTLTNPPSSSCRSRT
jgi:serine/threonine protein kinase